MMYEVSFGHANACVYQSQGMFVGVADYVDFQLFTIIQLESQALIAYLIEGVITDHYWSSPERIFPCWNRRYW